MKPLDSKDIAILEALQRNGRMSLSELGRQIGLSQPSVSERVARLESDGIICGYSARLNLHKLGLKLSAVIRLATVHDHIATCLKRFAGMPNIIEVTRVTGQDCFILKAVFADPGELEQLIDSIAQYGPVQTAVVLRAESPKVIGRELLSH